ncbi:MAG: hypothetical protein QOD06_1385 [Candidatus Binatota bacterium]|nr:hypothetical protein [Candidatus Binatota bacterium]
MGTLLAATILADRLREHRRPEDDLRLFGGLGRELFRDDEIYGEHPEENPAAGRWTRCLGFGGA